MEKLVMLLDIYEEEVVWVHSVGEKITDKEEARIISKKFWFIKRLVENDKIDLEECWIDYWRIHLVWEKSWRQEIIRQDLAQYEALLMLLSIQDEPISFLCEILK